MSNQSRGRWLAGLLLLATCTRAGATELVMATTFSPAATASIISRFQHQTQPQPVTIRTLNRTSSSLERLLDTTAAENIDLVLTSSPMLLLHLQQHQRLMPYTGAPAASQQWVPLSIRTTSVAVAISGFGMLINRSRMQELHLPLPTDWDSLAQPAYQSVLLMSSPSRSDTNHLMVEFLLQARGWDEGWSTLLALAGNLVTISSRSFGVADKIKTGLGATGLVIDNYANVLLDDPKLLFQYFPHSAAAPTYIAITASSAHPTEAQRFVRFLLSPQGQQVLADTSSGKFPVTPLPSDNPRAAQQQALLLQPSLDYQLIAARQALVQQLFDTAITFRLSQLKDAWRALHAAEARLNRPLPAIRALLSAVPVTNEQSTDANYQSGFNGHKRAEQQLMVWQQFFQHQQQRAISELEALK